MKLNTMTIVFAAQPNQPIDEISSPYIFFQLIFYLGVVLLLIYLLFYFIGKRKKIIKSDLLSHLGGIPLGQNKSIQIVEIGNKIYILGIGEDVNLIKIIESKEDIEAIKETGDNLSDPVNNRLSILFDRLKVIFKFSKNGQKDQYKNQFENELAEKIEQIKEKRIQSVNQWFDERDEDVEKRDQHE